MTADLDALATAWIQNHVLPRSAVSLRRANRVARLGFHARLAAELPALERFYARQAGASAICLAPERASA